MVVCELGDEGIHNRVEDAVPSKERERRRQQDGINWKRMVEIAHYKGPGEQEDARDEVEAQHESMSIVVGQGDERYCHEKV